MSESFIQETKAVEREKTFSPSYFDEDKVRIVDILAFKFSTLLNPDCFVTGLLNVVLSSGSG